MNKIINMLLVSAVILGGLIVGGVFFVVDETEQVVVTQFGQLVGRPIKTAGLKIKLPFVQKVNSFDKRLLEWDGDATECPTRDGRFIWVDTTARWLIEDPLEFMKSVRSEIGAQTRLDDILDGSTREVISNHVLSEIIRSSNRLLEEQRRENIDQDSESFSQVVIGPIEVGREQLSSLILDRANKTVLNYGIKLVDIKIKRLSYKDSVRNKVYERMISERNRVAEKYRAEGQGKKAEIVGQMAKKLKLIRSEAYKKSQELKGIADAEAIKIYAEAYNKDPDYYAFIKTLETYKNIIKDDTVFILSTDNELYKYLNESKLKDK